MTAQEQLNAVFFVKKAAMLGLGMGAYAGYQGLKKPVGDMAKSYVNAGKHVLNTGVNSAKNVVTTAFNNSKTPWTPIQNAKRLGGAMLGGFNNNVRAFSDGVNHVNSTARYATLGMSPVGALTRRFVPPTQLPAAQPAAPASSTF